jgi:hypothetical protein
MGRFSRVEPRGVEPLTSAVQRRIVSLLGVSGACKTAAKARVSFMTLFSSFQVIYSGCCAVAAQMVAGFLGSNSSPVVLLYVWWSADVSVWAASRTPAYGSWIQPPSTWLPLPLAAVLAHEAAKDEAHERHR